MMTPSKCALALAAALTAWPILTAGAAAQTETPPPPPPAVETGPPPMSLSLTQAVQMSLKNNLDIRIADFNPRVREQDIIFREAAFDPNAGGSVTWQKSNNPSNNIFDVGQVGAIVGIKQELWDYNAGFFDRLKYGANYSVNLELLRLASSSANSVFPILYRSTLDIIYNQSLLRNFGRQANETLIVIAQNDYSVSRSQFRQRVLDTLKATEDAYWDLVFARQDLDVNRQALGLAAELLKLNRIKVQVGTLPPIEITQADAEVANREQGVIVAENAVSDAEDALRRVLNMPKEGGNWDLSIAASDEPSFVERPVNLPAELETAIAHRPDLEQARLNVKTADARMAFDRNQMRWDLNFRAQYSLGGLGGDVQQAYDPNGVPLFLPSELQNQDFFDPLSSIRDQDFATWTGSLFLSVPIGNRAAKASYAGSRLVKEQSEVQYDNTRLNAEVQVRNAARAIVTGKKRIEAAEKNVELQKKKVEAEQKKFENGMSTSFQVLTFQNDLITALGTKNRALVDYRKALSALEQAKGTLDDYLKVSVQ